MTIRTADDSTHASVESALRHLRAGRTKLRQTNCPRVLEKVRNAIKSIERARRNCDHRRARTQA